MVFEAGRHVAGLARSFATPTASPTTLVRTSSRTVWRRLSASVPAVATFAATARPYTSAAGPTATPSGFIRTPRFLLGAACRTGPTLGSEAPASAAEWYRPRVRHPAGRGRRHSSGGVVVGSPGH